MKNVELWVTDIEDTFIVLDRTQFSEISENPIIKYFKKEIPNESTEEIKMKIKDYLSDKYNKCNHNIEINLIYQNILSNINSARLELIHF